MKKPTIKMRLKEKDGQIWLRALIKHPMETGLRKDTTAGSSIPANYINHGIVEAKGKVVFLAQWSIAISKNPVLLIKFDGAEGDKVKLTWTDHMGESEGPKDQLRAAITLPHFIALSHHALNRQTTVEAQLHLLFARLNAVNAKPVPRRPGL